MIHTVSNNRKQAHFGFASLHLSALYFFCMGITKTLGCKETSKPNLEELIKKYKNRLVLLNIQDKNTQIMAVGLWDLLGYEEIKIDE